MRAEWIGVVILAVALTACGAKSASTNTEPPLVTTTELPADLNSVRYPLDEYRTDAQRRGLIEQAWNVVATQCLRRYGFDIPVGEAVERRIDTIEGRYDLVDEEKAKANGYQSPADMGSYTPLAQRIPTEARAVFDGSGPHDYRGQTIPPGGCREEANLRVVPGVNPFYVDELESAARKRVDADKRLADVLSGWRTCMRSAGYQYESPGGPFQTWQARRKPGEPVSDEEIATALADVKCKRETGLLGTWIALDVAYQRQAVDENAEQLKQYRQAMDIAASKAPKIVDGT